MRPFIVILATREGFEAHAVEAETEEEAGRSTGGHFVHVHEDNGEESIVHHEGEEKHALLVQGRKVRPKLEPGEHEEPIHSDEPEEEEDPA